MRRIVFILTSFAGLLFPGGASGAWSWWSSKTFVPYTIDIKSGVLGADVSPNDRFVAIYAFNSSDLTDRQNDEVVNEIQIWDWRQNKIVARKIVFRKRPVDIRRLGLDEQFVRYADAGSKLIIYQEGRLLVLNSATLDQLRDIDMQMSQWPWRDIPSRIKGFYEASHVADIEVDSAARRAAVLIRWGIHAGGELRVYDLESSNLLRRWDLPGGTELGAENRNGLTFFSHRPIAIDPSGKKVAISLGVLTPEGQSLPFGERNVRILDVDSGEATATINTGYPTGAVRFAAGDPLALLTVAEEDPGKDAQRDSIKLWNANTGALIREITSRPRGIRYYLDVSADGRVALAYTGYDRCGFFLLGMESGCSTINERFRLWDLSTGKVIASSSKSSMFEVMGLTPPGDLSRGSDRLRLSPRGDIALVYQIFHNAPVPQWNQKPPRLYLLQ